MTSEVLGLRERKRMQTRARIETAAVELALVDGFDQVTIDAVSERADISPRTFFNYFDSKEDAILGVQPPTIDEVLLAEHARRYADADLAGSLLGLIFLVMRPSLIDTDLREKRMRIIRDNPSLLGRQFLRITRMSEELKVSVQELLDAHSTAVGRPVLPGVADALAMAAIGAFRSAAHAWTRAGRTDDTSLIELEDHAAAILRDVLSVNSATTLRRKV